MRTYRAGGKRDMTVRKIFTMTAGMLLAFVLSMPANAAAQGFLDQRSAAQNQYEPPPNPPPGHGGTPPGQGGTPPGQGGGNPGQGNGKPSKPKGTKKGSGNVQADDTGGKKKKGSGTLGDTETGAGGVGGAGGSGGGNVLGANTTGSLERSGSLPFTGLEVWMLLALGLTALGAGVVTRRAARRPTI